MMDKFTAQEQQKLREVLAMGVKEAAKEQEKRRLLERLSLSPNQNGG